MNYYQILNVYEDCDFSTLKKSYYKQAKLCHPDLFSGDKQKEEQFKRLVNAFDVISDPVKRASYDQQLRDKVFKNDDFEIFNEEEFKLNNRSIMDSVSDDILEELIVGNDIDVDKSSLATLLQNLEQTEIFILYREAKNYYYNYQYKLAMNCFKKLVKKTPQNILYHYYLGQCFEKQHNFFKAVKHLRIAINLGKLRIPIQQLYRIKHELSEIIKKRNPLIRFIMRLGEPLETRNVGNFECDKILIAETEKSMNRMLKKYRQKHQRLNGETKKSQKQKRLK